MEAGFSSANATSELCPRCYIFEFLRWRRDVFGLKLEEVDDQVLVSNKLETLLDLLPASIDFSGHPDEAAVDQVMLVVLVDLDDVAVDLGR